MYVNSCLFTDTTIAAMGYGLMAVPTGIVISEMISLRSKGGHLAVCPPFGLQHIVWKRTVNFRYSSGLLTEQAFIIPPAFNK